MALNDSFSLTGSKPEYLTLPTGQTSNTVFNQGATVYFKKSRDVSSSSNDGSIASGASATLTEAKYLIAAQGTTSQLLVLRS